MEKIKIILFYSLLHLLLSGCYVQEPLPETERDHLRHYRGLVDSTEINEQEKFRIIENDCLQF
jgi:hypothetical protein